MGWKGGGAVWVSWFYQWVVPHWAPGHGGRLDVWANRRHTRRTCMLSSLAIRGQLYSEREEETKKEAVSEAKANENNLIHLYYRRKQRDRYNVHTQNIPNVKQTFICCFFNTKKQF